MPKEFQVTVVTVFLSQKVQPTGEVQQGVTVGFTVDLTFSVFDTFPQPDHCLPGITGHGRYGFNCGIVKVYLEALHRLT
jgi:hypothetical protein